MPIAPTPADLTGIVYAPEGSELEALIVRRNIPHARHHTVSTTSLFVPRWFESLAGRLTNVHPDRVGSFIVAAITVHKEHPEHGWLSFDLALIAMLDLTFDELEPAACAVAYQLQGSDAFTAVVFHAREHAYADAFEGWRLGLVKAVANDKIVFTSTRLPPA